MMKESTSKTNKEKTKNIYQLIRKIGDGLSRQYDELATTKRAS